MQTIVVLDLARASGGHRTMRCSRGERALDACAILCLIITLLGDGTLHTLAQPDVAPAPMTFVSSEGENRTLLPLPSIRLRLCTEQGGVGLDGHERNGHRWDWIRCLLASFASKLNGFDRHSSASTNKGVMVVIDV